MEAKQAEPVAPIDVGATFDVNGLMCRCTNIWIDEDGTAHVTLESHDRPPEKVAYDDIRDALLDGRAERMNSGHEAWQWREGTR